MFLSYNQGMREGPYIADTAALIGDPTRANMLSALMCGRALTAGELASLSGVSASTASAHLAQLVAGDLLCLAHQGRHRYYRLASPEVAKLIEALMRFKPPRPTRQTTPSPRDQALRSARSCYDHLAGKLGTDIFDSLLGQSLINLNAETVSLTPMGKDHFKSMGLEISENSKTRPTCRACLDWSERRFHLAGALGARLLHHSLDHHWVERCKDSRALKITLKGQEGFSQWFGLCL